MGGGRLKGLFLRWPGVTRASDPLFLCGFFSDILVSRHESAMKQFATLRQAYRAKCIFVYEVQSHSCEYGCMIV